MRALSQLFLDLFVVFEVLRQVSNHRLHLVVLEHQVFRALRLVVQLRSQLHILDHGQLRGALKLVFVRD